MQQLQTTMIQKDCRQLFANHAAGQEVLATGAVSAWWKHF
jgi:hypothetical protein